MNKVSLGAKPLIAPAPVLVIASYDAQGKANMMTAAWGGICSSEPPSVSVSIRKGRYSYENILAKKAFTVNIPQTTQAAAADYAGIYSGRNGDKLAATGLSTRPCEGVDAPIIVEFPFTLVCSLAQTVEVGVHTQFIGEIQDVLVAESALDESGQLDAALLQPLLFVPGKRGYYGIGEWVAQAFSVGKKHRKRNEAMALLPLYLEMNNAPCLVVGGGRVARRKIATLLKVGAVVDVISPKTEKAIDELAAKNPERLRIRHRPYASQDLSQYMLVIAATDAPEVNQTVFDDAQRLRIWVNVVDVPDLCTVQAAALMHRGPIQIAFNSGGECPALSAALRNEFEAACSPWLADYAHALGAARRWLIEHCDDINKRKVILNHFAEESVRKQFQELPVEALAEQLLKAVEAYWREMESKA